MQPIRMRCPNPKCRVILSIPQEMTGQRVRCAGCGESFPVPFLGRTAVRKPFRKAG